MWFDFFRFLMLQFNSSIFITIMILIMVDVITGVIVAIMQKSGNTLHGSIESSHFIKGIYRKILNILIYLMGVVFSFYSKQNMILLFCSYAIITYEGISIMENFALIGVPFPEKLKKFFEVFKNKDGD